MFVKDLYNQIIHLANTTPIYIQESEFTSPRILKSIALDIDDKGNHTVVLTGSSTKPEHERD